MNLRIIAGTRVASYIRRYESDSICGHFVVDVYLTVRTGKSPDRTFDQSARDRWVKRHGRWGGSPEIWERILPHRQLAIGPGSINTQIPGSTTIYSTASMTDGERVIFYYIGEVLCAPQNSIIIVDEPENHVHKAIQATLWDEIENSRPDCAFAYFTHDFDFSVSGIDGYKNWDRNFSNGSWDYEVLIDTMPLPELIYLEILGSRKNILFVGCFFCRLFPLV